MKLNTAPDNPVTMGGIAHVSEFKIRNSAKAFGILSSGLYANKIRAIIRELSCNAVDSHVAAGRPDTVFDVHLPTMLAPYFAIRDYGTGLSHDQVCNIYTTYFESTKADSNDFIGALGLGSKSPFSYTDNFTVTAIQNGHRGIYSAFINDTGVPSVALMGQDETDEADGVEVRFAVEDRYDFSKFVEESQSVFKHFRVQPNFTGARCQVDAVEYRRKDIVPGVHERAGRGYGHDSCNRAIMGHIEYPIDIPKAQLGKDLESLSDMRLDIYFNIGDIEFQASREGLQYTPTTIAAIRKKYTEIARVIDQIVFDEADAIDNMWKRRDYLVDKARSTLWNRAVMAYVKIDGKCPLLEKSPYYGDLRQREVVYKPKDLATEFNIEFKVLHYQSWQSKSRDVSAINYDGNLVINTSASVMFIDNGANDKLMNRVKYHARENFTEDRYIFVAHPADVTKPMLMDAFYADIHEPPAVYRMVATEVAKIPRIPKAKAVKINILYIEKDSYRDRYTWSQMQPVLPADVNPTGTNYYVALKGYEASVESTGKVVSAVDIKRYMLNCGIPALADVRLYGIRKGDIEAVRAAKNWVPVEELIQAEIGKIDAKKFCGGFVKHLDYNGRTIYNRDIAGKVGAASDYSKFVMSLEGNNSYNITHLQELATVVDIKTDMEDLMKQAKTIYSGFTTKYPLIRSLGHQSDDAALVEYIQLVDQHKKVI
jgi:hypothetical protein